MIFVTVGSELAFDRMVRVVDKWAGERGRHDVFAQIGDTHWRPSFLEFEQYLDPPEFARRFAAADCIIAHAGMGTILSALNAGKRILVMPRRACFRETRNDHQISTVQRLLEMGRVHAAMDEVELRVKLGELENLQAPDRIEAHASPMLLEAIRKFIHQL